MVSPDSRAYRARRQAETPLSVLCRFPGPALVPTAAWVSSFFEKPLVRRVKRRLPMRSETFSNLAFARSSVDMTTHCERPLSRRMDSYFSVNALPTQVSNHLQVP